MKNYVCVSITKKSEVVKTFASAGAAVFYFQQSFKNASDEVFLLEKSHIYKKDILKKSGTCILKSLGIYRKAGNTYEIVQNEIYYNSCLLENVSETKNIFRQVPPELQKGCISMNITSEEKVSERMSDYISRARQLYIREQKNNWRRLKI